MKYAANRFLLICALLIPSVSYANGLSEKEVKNLISKVDGAIASMDAGLIGASLSDNVLITMNISNRGQRSVLQPSKREYLLMLKEGWSQYSNYKYNRTRLEISSLTKDKAVVSADIHESMTVQSQRISAASSEEITIELVKGKALITKITAYVSM